MSTATHIPSTKELEGDDALETLRSTGWGRLFKDAFARLRAADGFSHARALAFQIALTALPALIAGVGIATALEQDDLRGVLKDTLLSLAPGPASQTLTEAFKQGSEATGSGAAIVTGLLAALISATVAMGQLERGVNRIYGIESDRPALRKYGRALFLAGTAGVLLLLSFVIFLAGSAIRQATSRTSGWSDTALSIWDVARWPLGVVFIVGAMAVLFRYAPRRDQPNFSWLLVGSGLAVLLWILLTILLSAYLEESREFGRTYGPLAGMIGMLLWSLASSWAVLFGVAVAAQLEAVRAGVPSPTTRSDG
jgi:YihY family inner membrane protein